MDDVAQVFLVDDDPDFSHVVETLATRAQYSVRTYRSALEFLGDSLPDAPGCLLLDFCLPAMNGLDALIELRRRGNGLPVVFLTGAADVQLAVEVMKLGAVDFLSKPFALSNLLQAMQRATELSREMLARKRQQIEGRQALDRLSDHERNVAQRLACGYETKSVARALQLSAKTVELFCFSRNWTVGLVGLA